MIHLGDITKIHGDQIEPVHCITFGSPCQGLSQAGKRLGLEDERSGLFMEAIRIVKEMREATNGIYPTVLIWENVFGALSCSNGDDFHAVLEEFAHIREPDAVIPRPKKWNKAGLIAGNGWSCAWRVLDAQYHGVPQRRRRIAALVCLDGLQAGDALFEYIGGSVPSDRESSVMDLRADMDGASEASAQRTGLPWNFEQSIPPWKGSARNPEDGTGGHDCVLCRMITERAGKPGGGKGILESVDLAGPLRAQYKDTLFEPVYCIQGDIARGAHFGQNGVGAQEDVSYTLNTMDVHAVCYPGYSVTSPQNQINVKEGDPCHSLTSDSRNYLAYAVDCRNAVVDPETNGTLQAKESGSSLNLNNVVMCASYQDKTGTLSPGAHPGSYNGQDAYNDMLITQRVYDARGNGDGKTVPTITDDHENRVTDYTAVCVQNTGQGWWNESDKGATLRTPCGGDATKANLVVQRIIRWIVRRLTPTECAALQGYPRNWCEIGEWVDSKGKRHKDADTPKYKAYGNSIALPQWWWLVNKMKPYLPEGAKLGSLFDGIGGFPLVWEETYGKGTARWASEIEEFPIAVTKYHFPEEEHS